MPMFWGHTSIAMLLPRLSVSILAPYYSCSLPHSHTAASQHYVARTSGNEREIPLASGTIGVKCDSAVKAILTQPDRHWCDRYARSIAPHRLVPSSSRGKIPRKTKRDSTLAGLLNRIPKWVLEHHESQKIFCDTAPFLQCSLFSE